MATPARKREGGADQWVDGVTLVVVVERMVARLAGIGKNRGGVHGDSERRGEALQLGREARRGYKEMGRLVVCSEEARVTPLASGHALATRSKHRVARDGDEGGADELQRCTRTSRARGKEEEEAMARTKTVGYRFLVGARRRALTEGERAPREWRRRGEAVGKAHAR